MLTRRANLELQLIEQLSSLRELLERSLLLAPDLRSGFRVRVGILNVISLFQRSIEARERLVREEARVEELISSKTLRRSGLVTYISGLRLYFSGTNNLYSEYEPSLEDEK